MRFELLKARKLAGLTQQEVGEAIGVDRFAYGRMENGKGDIPVEIAIKLASLFGQKVEDLFLPEDVNKIHQELSVVQNENR